MGETLEREAALRKDLSDVMQQTLDEKCTQMQEIQSRLERITQDGRRSHEEALEREAAMRKELSDVMQQTLDTSSALAMQASHPEEVQVQLRHELEVMLN